MFHIATTSADLVTRIQNITFMEFEITSTEKTISDICEVLRIEKLTPFAYDSIKSIVINAQRNSKFDGVINANNWIAKTDMHTGRRSLTVNRERNNKV